MPALPLPRIQNRIAMLSDEGPRFPRVQAWREAIPSPFFGLQSWLNTAERPKSRQSSADRRFYQAAGYSHPRVDADTHLLIPFRLH